jgi:hypothetical protein
MDPQLPPESPEEVNPYAPPQSAFVPEAVAPEFGQLPFTTDAVLSRTWSLFKEKMWPCLGAFWGMVGINWAVSFGASVLLAGVAAAIREPALILAANIAANVVSIVVQLWLQIGLTIVMLRIARREQFAFADIFTGGRYILGVFLSGLIFVVIFVVSIALVAGISVPVVLMLRDQPLAMIAVLTVVIGLGASLIVYYAVRLAQFYYLIIDRNVGVFDSFGLSWQITRNRVPTLLLIYLVQFAIGMAGLLLCIVGIIWAAPLATLLLAVTYLALIGEATAPAKPAPEIWEEEL